MAVAFYIPDQATLLRKASEREQQILRMREAHWRMIASIVLDALQQYIDSTPNYMPARRGAASCAVTAHAKDKFRKSPN